MKCFLGIVLTMMCLSSCVFLRGYSDEELNNIGKVAYFKDDASMHATAKLVKADYTCDSLGIVTGESGYGSYDSEGGISGAGGSYKDSLFYARVAALRKEANAIVIKNTVPNKNDVESPKDHIYTLNAHAYKCNVDLKSR